MHHVKLWMVGSVVSRVSQLNVTAKLINKHEGREKIDHNASKEMLLIEFEIIICSFDLTE